MRENAAARTFLAARGLTPPSSDFARRDYFRAAEVENRTQTESRKGNAARPLSAGQRQQGSARRASSRTVLRDLPGRGGRAGSAASAAQLQDNRGENPDGFDVFAQLIDIETGKIIAQRESEVTGTDDAALAAAMQAGAAQLAEDAVTIGPLSDGKLR